MSDDRSTFETTRARLEDIVIQVRRKDVSLEQSLDMLEEAVRLVNQCNDLIDQTSFRAPIAEGLEGAEGEMLAEVVVDVADIIVDEGEDASIETVVVETFELLDENGDDIGDIEFVEFISEDAPVEVPEIEDDERS